jgi:hypothetical protein
MREMDDRIEKLRLYFPAEVTGGYLAIQRLLAANGVHDSEQTYFMLWVALLLAALNILIYIKSYSVENYLILGVITVGFFIWVINIDQERFKDLPFVGYNIETVAPTLLIFYTLVTAQFKLPGGKSNAK